MDPHILPMRYTHSEGVNRPENKELEKMIKVYRAGITVAHRHDGGHWVLRK